MDKYQDLELSNTTDWDKDKYLLAKLDLAPFNTTPHHPSLLPAWTVFWDNLCRLPALQQFPVFLSGMAGISQATLEVVVRQSGYPDGLYKGKDAIVVPVEKWKAIVEESRDRIFENYHAHDPELKGVYKNGTDLFEVICFDFRDDLVFQDAVQGIFQTMVIGAWTAIEVLLAQMRDAAVEGREMPLPKEEECWHWRILNLLESDHGAKAGKPFKYTEPQMSSLRGARIAYAVAFQTDSEDIDKALCVPAIDALNLMRNQLVHEGGRINRDFIRTTKRFPTLERFQAMKGKQMVLTGDLVKQLIEEALSSAVLVVKSVDVWLQKPPLPAK